MGRLADRLLELIRDEHYVIGLHASERLEEQGILEWQAVESLTHGRVVAERPAASPNPTIEVVGLLPDGADVKTVWAHLRSSEAAKLVTIHFLE